MNGTPLPQPISSDELCRVVCRHSRPVQASAAGQAPAQEEHKTLCRRYSSCMQYIVWLYLQYLQSISLVLPCSIALCSAVRWFQCHRASTRTVAHSCSVWWIYIWTIFRVKRSLLPCTFLVALVVWWNYCHACCCSRKTSLQFYGQQKSVYLMWGNLQPLFISCAGFRAIFFVGSLIIVVWEKTLQPFVLKKTIACYCRRICAIASWGFFRGSLFNTNAFPSRPYLHGGSILLRLFLLVFQFFQFVCVIPQTGQSRKVIFSNHRWGNAWFRFWFKCLQLVCARFMLFRRLYEENKNDKSAVFEWLIYQVRTSWWSGSLPVCCKAL